jgi:hypothetical protein
LRRRNQDVINPEKETKTAKARKLLRFFMSEQIMCEHYQPDIEHPNQDDWGQHGSGGYLSEVQKKAIEARYADVASVIDFDDIFSALNDAAATNHDHRTLHDQANKTRLGITTPVSNDPQPNALKHEYDGLTGRSEKIGDFIHWFSSISHEAFVAQESLPPERRFRHVSLELGGVSQMGNWEADRGIEKMASSIPARVLESAPYARLTMYGQKWTEHLHDERVTYVDSVPYSYVLMPKPTNTPRRFDFDHTLLRQRFPFADIYLEGKSDVVVFGERIGLLVMPMIEKNIRDAIIDDSWRVAEEKTSSNTKVKLQDTPGARMAGAIFENALRSPEGTTKDIIPVSVHYVQGVGEKFAQLRHKTS